jgi:hypothetical protein
MNEPDKSTNPGETPASQPPRDWREMRREEREKRWAARAERWEKHGGGRSGLIWGVILILLGGVFMLQNAGFRMTDNWWAIFILIPAFWSYVGAWDSYREGNRLTRHAAGKLTGGVLLTVIALVFLFGVAMESVWPLLLIVGGVALILTGMVPM